MRSKHLLLIILVVLFFSGYEKTHAQAPDWLWAKGIGGSEDDRGYSIATDDSGNVYTTGFFRETVDFDPDSSGSFNLISSGNTSLFISKLDSYGNFIWAKAIGGTDEVYGNSIALDPANGDLYITGYFDGTTDFDPDSSVTFNLSSAGGYYDKDIFIFKLDKLGNFVWAKAMGGTGWDASTSIAFDPAGSGGVYTTGSFQGTVDFDPDSSGNFNLTSVGDQGFFISKLDGSGNFIWAKAMGGSDQMSSKSIVLDHAGNGDIYTTGTFIGTVDFDPDSSANFNLTSAGGIDIFISKLNNLGNFVWAKAIGGAYTDDSYFITLDHAGSGDVYTTGYFQGTVDFDPDSSGNFDLTSAGSADIFILKLDGSGNFVWAKSMGGTGYGFCRTIGIDPSGSGDVYTTGYFDETVDFDPDSLETFNLNSGGSYDIFISKLDALGNFVWAKRIGGTDVDIGTYLALDASGNVYITGYFISPSISFDPATLSNAGGSDIFITKLKTALATGNNEIKNIDNSISLFPNPTTNHFTLTVGNSNKKIEVTIADITGKIIYITTTVETQKIEVNLKDVEAGLYVVQIQTSDFMETKKLIVTR